MDRSGVTERDVVVEVVVAENRSTSVGKPLGSNLFGALVDRDDPPPVPVADLVDTTFIRWCARLHDDGGVVGTAHDDVTDGDLLVACDG
jgi:hypothetical protein